MNIEKRIDVKKIIKKYGKNQYDTGSTQVQLFIQKEKLLILKKHILKNKKDISNRVIFIQKLQKYHKLIKYLKYNNPNLHEKLAQQLKF